MVPLNRVTTSSVGNRGRANEDGKQTGLDKMNFKPVKCMMIIIMLGWTEKKRLAAFSAIFYDHTEATFFLSKQSLIRIEAGQEPLRVLVQPAKVF